MIELRTTCRDNTFSGNVLKYATTRPYSGLFSHFSNQCCDSDGVLMDEAGQGPCQPPYAAGYDVPCYSRRNTFANNSLYGPQLAVNFGDGSYQSTFTNNLIVGKVVLSDASGGSALAGQTIPNGASVSFTATSTVTPAPASNFAASGGGDSDSA